MYLWILTRIVMVIIFSISNTLCVCDYDLVTKFSEVFWPRERQVLDCIYSNGSRICAVPVSLNALGVHVELCSHLKINNWQPGLVLPAKKKKKRKKIRLLTCHLVSFFFFLMGQSFFAKSIFFPAKNFSIKKKDFFFEKKISKNFIYDFFFIFSICKIFYFNPSQPIIYFF